MFSIVITERGGAQRQLELDALEISIGRIEDNDVVLPRSNVSKRHARLVLKDDRYVLIDLKSTNGTYINGRRLGAPMLVGVGDKIYIGDFILSLQEPSRPSVIDRHLARHQITQPLRSVSDAPPIDTAVSSSGSGAPASASLSAPAGATLSTIETARFTVGTPTSRSAPPLPPSGPPQPSPVGRMPGPGPTASHPPRRIRRFQAPQRPPPGSTA